MSNTLLTTSEITNDSAMVLVNELVFADKCDRQYADDFAVTGAKIGYTINIRKPPRFIGTVGPALAVEDVNETFMPLTLTTQFHVDVQITTADLTVAVDMFRKRIGKPAMAAVGNRVDRDGFIMAYQNIANTVGTPGNPPSSLNAFLQAGAYLDSEGFPRDGNRRLILDQWSMAAALDGVKGLFNPQASLGKDIDKGLIAREFAGMDWYMDQNAYVYTVGAQGGSPKFGTAGTSSAVLSAGWANNGTLYTTGWTASTAVLNVGDIITIAGVYAVNPQNRGQYGSNKLRQFVVQPPNGSLSNGTFTPTYAPGVNNTVVMGGTYTSDGSGILQITVADTLIYGGQFQNVATPATPTTGPANNAAITVLGTGGTASPQSILMHKDAFVLGFADLDVPGGVDMAARVNDEEDAISIRMVRAYTINNDALPTRFDLLYGYAPLYRSGAVRLPG